MPRTEIAPSILAADLTRLGEQVREAADAGADRIHIDVMDGHFVPNLSFGPSAVEACRRVTDLYLDVHLMIERPERLLDAFVEAGASGVTVHAEATPHVHRALDRVRALGAQPGLVVNPLTPLDVFRDALPEIATALVMSVDPGFGGQRFLPGTLERLRRLRDWRDERNPSCRIEVDGGVDARNAAEVVGAGADVLVAGSALFGPGGVRANLATLRAAIRGA